MFSPVKPMYEAPILGAVAGAFLGGGGTLAGMLSVGGLVGGLAGAVGGSLLGDMMKGPDLQQSIAQPAQPAAVPQTPAAPSIPNVPSTPSANPGTGGGLGAGEGPGGSDTPVDVGGPSPEPFTPGEAAPPTSEEVTKGELQRKRKGRVSTILTTPQSRLRDGEDEDNEKLGG